MKFRFTKSSALIAAATGLLLTILSAPLHGQPADESRPTFGYDKAHEITLTATLEQVVTQHVPGTPAGLHLLVATSDGSTDVHIGPYMTKETVDALHAGTPVQITGAMAKLNGRSYLLARQMVFGGRMVKVRTENGFLFAGGNPHKGHSAKSASHLEGNGGAQ
jgi:hypothetical protein